MRSNALLKTLMHVPGAAGIVAQGQEEHGGEPKNTCDDDELGPLGAVVCVHEEKHYEEGFASSNYESHDDIQASVMLVEVHGRGVHGRDCENH